MSVLIKGMRMPENCIKCPMQYGGWCYVAPPEINERVAPTVDEAAEQGKPKWCPLVEVPATDDCISRQAAIDALKNRWKKTRNYEGNGDDIAEECELYLKQVPSAQPEHDENELNFMQPHKRIPVQLVVSSDCISRQAAIDELGYCQTYLFDSRDKDKKISLEDAEYAIEQLPSAQPERTEIIRCKDCNKASKCYGDVIMRSRGGGNIYCPLEFCSEAERRTDEAD